MRDTTRGLLLVLLFSTGCDAIGLYGPRCNGGGSDDPFPTDSGPDTDTSSAAPIVLVLGHEGQLDGNNFDGTEWYGLYDVDDQAYMCAWDVPAWGTRSVHYYTCYDCLFTFDIYAAGEVSVWADEEDDFGVSFCDIYGISDGDTAGMYDTSGNAFYRPIGFMPFYGYGYYTMTDVVVYYNQTYGWFPVAYGNYGGGSFDWYYVFWDYYYQ